MLKKRGQKEIHKKPISRWNKQVLQNKNVGFRPTDNQAKFLNSLINKSLFIKRAIDFKMEFCENHEKFFIKYGRKVSMPFERANRKLKRERKEKRLIYDSQEI